MTINFFAVVAIVALWLTLVSSAFAAPLAGSEWGLTKKPEQFLQFRSGNKVSGYAGCNRLIGDYRSVGVKLVFLKIATTRKFCSPDTMKAEKVFLDALNDTASFQRIRRKLVLKNANEKSLLSMRHRDWD